MARTWGRWVSLEIDAAGIGKLRDVYVTTDGRIWLTGGGDGILGANHRNTKLVAFEFVPTGIAIYSLVCSATDGFIAVGEEGAAYNFDGA